MKKLMFVLLATTGSIAATAQGNGHTGVDHEETIVIKKDAGDSTTTIEIKNGKVFVNGEEMASMRDPSFATLHKKIIINSDGERPQLRGDMGGFQFPNNIMNGGRTASTHPMLGVYTAQEDEDMGGAKVDRIAPNSAAEKAGLKAGDQITAVDGDKVTTPKDLVAAVALHSIGDTVTIAYNRAGKAAKATAVLTDTDGNTVAKGSGNDADGNDMMNGLNGMSMEDLQKAMGSLFGQPASSNTPTLGIAAEDIADGKGVKVAAVKPESAAASNGLVKGDVITKLGDYEIGSVDDIQSALRDVKVGTSIKMKLKRDGKIMTKDFAFPKATKTKDL